MQKHQNNILACFCIAIMLFANSLFAQFSGGTGTETDPFQIKTPADLNTIRNYIGDVHTGKYFKLMNDIDLTEYLAPTGAGYNNGAFWSPISSVDAAMFRGKFDGCGFAIKNLKINLPTVDNTGLFGYLGAGAEIKNVSLINADVKGKNATGILIGANRGGSIINSSSSGQVSGALWVGGLVGFHESNGVNGLISNCYSTAAVSCSGSAAGGLAGQNGALAPGNSIIENSYATGSVSCVDHAGGLIGHQNGNGIVRNCYASGIPTNSGDPANKGGLAGFAQGSVTDSYWDKESSGISTSAGSDPSFGKTTAEMKTQTTYAGWDFTSIWHFSSTEFNGYPHLAWQAHVTFAGGTGTSSDPFLITTADQLSNVRNYLGSEHANKYFKLMNDLDLAPYLAVGGNGYTLWGAAGWLPIGSSSISFSGKFDGNGHVISNLACNRSTESNQGLFGIIWNGSIKNLGLVNANISGKYNCAVLCCQVSGVSTISDIFVTGNLRGTSTLGGIASMTAGTVVIENCYSWVNITSQYGYVGGITGRNVDNQNPTQINNCYSTGRITVSTGSDIGGLNGAGGTVSNSFWDKVSTNQATSAGSDAALYGKTTEQMKTQSTYTDWFTNGKWHFSTNQNYGYPHLAWQVFNDATPPQIMAISGTEAKAGVPLNITITAIDESNIASVQGFYRLEGETNWTTLVMTAVNGTNNFTTTIPAQNTAIAGKVKFTVTDYGYPSANILQSREYFIAWSLGSGTESDPYQIYRAEDLAKLHNYTALPNAAELNYKVMCDFDLSTYLANGGAGYALWGEYGWLPIGGDSYGFTGKFDGNGHKITGLKATRGTNSWFLGLFSIVKAGAVVKNLGVETDPAASMTGAVYVGIIAGDNKGSITNCYTKGKVEATRLNNCLAGGISANNWGLISNCYSTAEVISTDYAGGITSYNYYGGNIVNCYAAGKIYCNYFYTGGVTGRNHPDATISGCYWDVEATGLAVSFGSDPAIYGKTTAEMRKQESFADWDFIQLWHINQYDNNGYPHLAWENYPPHPSAITANQLPNQTELYNNYPNPFNPSTTIKFDLKSAGLTRLAIYNAKGELVKTLVNGMQNPGRYSVNFDGEGLNSGVYFYKLEADGKSIVKRMLMVK